MSTERVVRVRKTDDGVAAHTLRDGVAAIQAELEVTPEFPAEVEEAAARAAASPRLPDLDRTDLPLVTIDPPTSMDLDQALHIERDGAGYVVHYAIADVAAFITPGDPVDVEANRRGETLYGADSKVPLHPKSISEDAGSLLADQVRPALLWTIKVDETGEGTDVTVERARVRSTAKLDYATAQQSIDDGTAVESLVLLKEVGLLRLEREAARGGVSLPLPEQEIVVDAEHWHLEFREMLPVEQWNAQISLLTGFAAASLMVYARVGLLRTLPQPDPHDVQRLHRTAKALGIEWPAEQLYPDFIRALDTSEPAHAAMVDGQRPAAARERVRRLRRRGARGAPARRPRLGVRPRHRAAPAARRPLCRRGLPGAVRRGGRALVGDRQARRAPRDAAGLRAARTPLRGLDHGPGRGRHPRRPRGRPVRRRRRGRGRGRTPGAARSPSASRPSRRGSPLPRSCRSASPSRYG